MSRYFCLGLTPVGRYYTEFVLSLGTHYLVYCSTSPFSIQLLCSVSVSYLVNELQFMLWCWSDKQSCDLGKCWPWEVWALCGNKWLCAYRLLSRMSVVLKWLGITQNGENIPRSSRSTGGKQEPTQGKKISQFRAENIPFKPPKLQKHTCIKHPLLGDRIFCLSIHVVVKFSLSAKVCQAVDIKRNGIISVLLSWERISRPWMMKQQGLYTAMVSARWDWAVEYYRLTLCDRKLLLLL